ncbi:hypothetical protein ACK3TF_001844 [Chlorella vulgaris]
MTLTPQGPHALPADVFDVYIPAVIHGAVYGAAIAAGAGWISRRLTAAQSSSKPLESTVSLANYTAEVVNAWRHEAEAKRLKEELATSQAQLAKVSAELAALRPEADDQELAGMTADTQVQAVSASPGQIDSNSKRYKEIDDLIASCRAERALARQSIERSKAARAKHAVCKEEDQRRQQGLPAATGKPTHIQPVLPPTAGPWPQAAGSAPVCRTAAAEASSAAALVWAASAMGLEAKAEASATLMASLPATERTHVAVEWHAAAAAWRAAFEELEYARQADPQAAVVQQTEQSIRDMRGFKRQCQQWGEAS